MAKKRLDISLVEQQLVRSRSQAESYIKLESVTVNGRVIKKPGFLVGDEDVLKVRGQTQYVSRAALKLASVAEKFDLQFQDKTVLDVGSSTGGFTDFALRNGAKKVIAVEVGKDQLHPSLHGNDRIELYEQTDIRDVVQTSSPIDIAVADVSFVSLRDILPHVGMLVKHGDIVAMVKPQFEATYQNLKHKGVIKNEKLRREILSAFELWARRDFVVLNKADSEVVGTKGNRERFYLLKPKSAQP